MRILLIPLQQATLTSMQAQPSSSLNRTPSAHGMKVGTSTRLLRIVLKGGRAEGSEGTPKKGCLLLTF